MPAFGKTGDRVGKTGDVTGIILAVTPDFLLCCYCSLFFDPCK